MNQMHGIQPPGVVGVGMAGMGISPGMMQQSSPQQQPMQSVMVPQNPGAMPHPGAPIPAQQQAEKFDNISKVKSLIGPLRESLSTTLKTSAQLLQYNNLTDNGTIKGVDNNNPPPRFDKHLEEFYSICDQIELHLKTSVQCLQQNSSAQRYLPTPVALTRVEPIPPTDNGLISYPQYLATVRTQIAYAKDIHDTLICAAQNISPSE